MSQLYLGQIIQGGWNFAPLNTALCNGQTIPIQQNSALFSLLGTTYGGNGTTTFNLPDLRSRVPIHWGQGQGLSDYAIGQVAGAETVTLLTPNLPSHTHAFTPPTVTLNAATDKASSNVPAAGAFLARAVDAAQNGTAVPAIYAPAAGAAPVALGGVNVAGGSVGPAGGSQPVSILQPYLAITFVIVLQGIYPSRG